MLEIQMSKDIKTFEPTIVGPFTLRQIVWITIGTVLAVPVFFFMPGEINVRILAATLIAAPLFMCGWVKVQGMYLDKYLKIIFIYTFLESRNRVNDDGNVFEKSTRREKVRYLKRRDKNIKIYR